MQKAKLEKKKDTKKVKKASSDDDDDDGGPDGGEESSGAESGSLQRDHEGKEFLPLPGHNRRITVSQFKGNTLIDIREVSLCSPPDQL